MGVGTVLTLRTSGSGRLFSAHKDAASVSLSTLILIILHPVLFLALFHMLVTFTINLRTLPFQNYIRVYACVKFLCPL